VTAPTRRSWSCWDEKREKRAEARAKKAAETRKAMEDAEAQAQHDGGVEPVKEESEDKKE